MALDSLKFQVAFGAVRHFGRNLYSTNPPAIAELVANAWDAYATKCDIYINRDCMLIVDNGIGMTNKEFQERYATSGNEKDTNIRKPDGMNVRPYMGKKGIGKFSAFSLADQYELFTKSSDDTQWKHIKLEQDILNTSTAEIDVPVEWLDNLTSLHETFGCELSSVTTGTIILLPHLKRLVNAATIKSLRKLLSHRFSITTIINDGKFDVSITVGIAKEEIDLKKHFYDSDIEYLHYFGYTEKQIKERFANISDDYLISEDAFKRPIKGWIGSVALPSSLVVEDETALKGVCVYINGKLVDEDILKSIKKDRMSDTYIVGEVDADYLANLEEDVVLSSREGLFLDNVDVVELKQYLESVRKNLVLKWDDMRKSRPLDKQDYMQTLLSKPQNKEYYDKLDEPSKKRFNRYAQKLFDRPKSNRDESFDKLNNLLFSALLQIVNNESIQELISKNKGDEKIILECFSKIFDLTEINHALRLRDSVRTNLAIIRELEKFIETGEVEKVFEKHLSSNPWLIKPTWISKVKSVHTQDYYTLLNIDNGDEKKLYTDIIVEVSDEIYPVLVEIKREKATKYSTPDVTQICTQIYNYQKVISEKLTRELGHTVTARDIKAYFICGQKAFDKLDQNDRDKLNQNGIILKSYDELIRTSKRIFEVSFGEDIGDLG